MADFTSVTASNGVKVTDPESCREFLNRFYLDMEYGQMEVDEDGYLNIYGYDWFHVTRDATRAEVEKQYNDYCTGADVQITLEQFVNSGMVDKPDAEDEFLEGIQQFIPEGEKLIIHCIGNEKCRFPLVAWECIVTRDKIEHFGFKG